MSPRLACTLSTLGLLTVGCAPSLSTMEPARTVPAGHLQVSTSFDATETTGPVREVLDDIESMDNLSGRISSAELTQVAEATSVALVQPPAIGMQVSAAYGVSRTMEIGLRSSINAVRGWTRYQFLRIEPGVYGAVGLGVTGYIYGFPVQQFADEISVTSFTRWDLDLPLSIGYSSRIFHIWGGPKLILSAYDAKFSVCVDDRGSSCRTRATGTLDGTAAYVGGQLGMAIGYERIWFALELTLARVGTNANLVVERGDRTETATFDPDGLAISPSVGLIAWF